MKCSICKKTNFKKVIDLGMQPLANKYPKNEKEILKEKLFNLSLLYCSNCLLVRIENIISRKKMFEDYYYLSSVNLGLVRHFNKLAKKIKSKSFVLDIGSNDGILLRPLKKLGIKAVGVDPSINVGKIANNNGLETIIDFFSEKTVKNIIKKHGHPDNIVASSIFTHLEKPKKFANNIKQLLTNNGMFILEVEYLSNFISNVQFERFYFDRPFYYSLTSIDTLFKSIGMSLLDIEKINVHGGSLRCYIKNAANIKASKKVTEVLNNEKKVLTFNYLKNFNKKISKEAKFLKNNLLSLKKKNKKIFGYGAPARVSTITNLAKIDSKLIEAIIDDSPLKQNRFSPGKHIPIKSNDYIKNKKVDILVVFAYDYFKDIKKNTKKIKCKYYMPIPFKILK